MEHEHEDEFLKIPKTKTLLWTLCGILAILITFGLGLLVGYRRAIFAADFGEGYYRSVYGDPFGKPMIGAMGMGPVMMHGVAGEVLDVSSDTITVEDPNGNEESVLIMANTPVREMGNDVSATIIQPDDRVVVIGEPDASGEVDARFIRVLESSSSNF